MTGTPIFAAVERQSVVALATDQIKLLIATGELQPGHRLPSERALSELLGVSRPSVREAIRALDVLGLVEIRHGAGTFVVGTGLEAIGEALGSFVHTSRETLAALMEVRVWLEAGAAEVAAERITEAQLEELEEILQGLRASLGDVPRFVEGDIAFHQAIHAASGNSILSTLMLTVSELAKQSRLVTAKNLSVRRSTLREHELILDALRNRDPAAAGRAMRVHLRHVAPHLRDVVEREV